MPIKSGFSLTASADIANLHPMAELAAVEATMDAINSRQADPQWSKPIRASSNIDRAEVARRLGASK